MSNDFVLGACSFLLTTTFGLLAFICQRLLNTIEAIDLNVRDLTVKIARHEEQFKRLEDKLS